MSTDYIICCHLPNIKFDINKFDIFLKQNGLKNIERGFQFVYDDSLILNQAYSKNVGDQSVYYQEIASRDASPIALIDFDGFYFTHGFITLLSKRYCLTEITSNSLNSWTSIKKKNALALFVDLFNAIEADSMVLGIESDYETLFNFFNASSDTSEVNEFIMASIGAPEKSNELLIGAGGSKCTISGHSVIYRWFSDFE